MLASSHEAPCVGSVKTIWKIDDLPENDNSQYMNVGGGFSGGLR